MYFLFLACSQQSSFILLEEYAREHQLSPPTSLQSNIHILTLENGWKISVQYHPKNTQNEVTLHGGLYLSNAPSSAQATQVITKMMTWNYEMSGAYFSVNPQTLTIWPLCIQDRAGGRVRAAFSSSGASSGCRAGKAADVMMLTMMLAMGLTMMLAKKCKHV